MSIFSKVAMPRPAHNTFDLSHDRKMSIKMGELVPTVVMECVPGDSFTLKQTNLTRFAPMLAPIMHQCSVYTHYFFVPTRLVWDKWEDFITGGLDGLQNPAFPVLQTSSPSIDVKIGSLADYMGLPDGDHDSDTISAVPFAMYNKIYNDYYMDENLSTPLSTDLSSGSNNYSSYWTTQKRAWQHDYFTSALPWTQKGPEATIPLGIDAPLKYGDYSGSNPADEDYTYTREPQSVSGSKTAENVNVFSTLTGSSAEQGAIQNSAGDFYNFDITHTHVADLKEASSATINELRRAFRLQEWLERNARGGSRYIEVILAHFGVQSSDARLQRAEFLGGSATPMSISEVLQTSNTANAPTSDDETPQGNMAGHGVSVGASNTCHYKCEEHGYIIGIMSVMPKSAYQQGVPKHFTKFDKFDYFWPSFANIGEQPIYNKELYNDTSDNKNDDVFGYTPRYAEYKYIPSTVHGEMRKSLNFWHMGRIFGSRPSLNQDFIEMDADEVSRIFAVQEADSEDVYVYLHNKIKARRPMPYFGTPTI